MTPQCVSNLPPWKMVLATPDLKFLSEPAPTFFFPLLKVHCKGGPDSPNPKRWFPTRNFAKIQLICFKNHTFTSSIHLLFDSDGKTVNGL